MTDGVSDDDDDNSENKSVDSMANRKRKLNSILGSNKRMHVEQSIKGDIDFDSDSNHENMDRATSVNDNDDGGSSRMSDFDDGKWWKAIQNGSINWWNSHIFKVVLIFERKIEICWFYVVQIICTKQWKCIIEIIETNF